MAADLPPDDQGARDAPSPRNGAASASVDWTLRAIHVSEVRPDGFVGFDFIVGDPDIYVEMLLSPEAFDQFCEDQKVEPDYAPRSADCPAFPRTELRDVVPRPATPGSASEPPPDQ